MFEGTERQCQRAKSAKRIVPGSRLNQFNFETLTQSMYMCSVSKL